MVYIKFCARLTGFCFKLIVVNFVTKQTIAMQSILGGKHVSIQNLKLYYWTSVKSGVPAEDVAGKAVEELTRNLDSGGCVDEHLQDQVSDTPTPSPLRLVLLLYCVDEYFQDQVSENRIFSPLKLVMLPRCAD